VIKWPRRRRMINSTFKRFWKYNGKESGPNRFKYQPIPPKQMMKKTRLHQGPL